MRTNPNNSHNLAQLELVQETLSEVERSLVAVLGGAKDVGPRMYPQKSPSTAQTRVLDCVNPDRDRHQFSDEEFVTLLKWAREKGYHAAFYWICDELGYSHPSPIEPDDQRAELQRQFLAGVERMEQLARRLGK